MKTLTSILIIVCLIWLVRKLIKLITFPIMIIFKFAFWLAVVALIAHFIK